MLCVILSAILENGDGEERVCLRQSAPCRVDRILAAAFSFCFRYFSSHALFVRTLDY